MSVQSNHSFRRSFAWVVIAFAVTLGAPLLLGAPTISEFMAAGGGTHADEDGANSDWIEIHNPDTAPVDLSGWYLTDTANNKRKWQFPAVTVPPGGYVVVFASNKNRRDPARELHTNFALSADGEYLGLVQPDGTTVASEYAPDYPAQIEGVSYGLAPRANGGLGTAGFLLTPTPAKTNSNAGSAALDQLVSFSRAPGPFANTFQLQLTGADAGQRIRYVVTPPLPGGAEVPAPTATSPVYTGPLTIDRSLIVRAAVFAADGSAHGIVSSAYYARLDPTLATFATTMPVLVLDGLGSGELFKDDLDHPAWLYVYNARDNTPTFRHAPDLITPLTASVRGSSSADFPKRGYNLKLLDEAGDKRPQALLDLGSFDRWALVAPWSFDLSYVNNAFTYALSNRLGRWAPRTQLAEVFFNTGGDALSAQDYAGIYVLTDRIEIGEGRVEVDKMAKKDVSGSAVTGGYLLKLDTQDPDEFGWWPKYALPENSASSLVLVAPKADDMTNEQRDYIVSYVQRMEDALQADAASGWSERTYLDFIDRASWVDHHILNTFTANPDAFERSAYFTKPRNGKLQAGPVWDFDRALGSVWDERSYRWDVWFGVGATDVWNMGWWGMIARDPEFMQDWIDRWQSLRREEMSNGALAALVDAHASSVSHAAATRDAARWPDSAPMHGTYPDMISNLRGWVVARAGWIDTQFVAAPTVVASGSSITFTPPAGATLAYTLDGSDPRSLGGNIAPNAKFSPGPLTVSASENVHVRSYRADLVDTFPGSPWSSAVGGEESSPLLPRARLVNISSRAIVGSDENALIAGVVVADTMSKRYLARAVGPGLAAFGASGIVPDPQLGIFSSSGVELYRNTRWETGPDASRLPDWSKSVGAFPLAAGSLDSALANEIGRGAYTVQITTPSNQSGIGLAELYELDDHGRTVNLSTRANVRSGEGVLIGGFVVQGPAYKRMLVRAVGPMLDVFGVTNSLRDPVLTIYRGQEVIASNDRWDVENGAVVTLASSSVGAFALPAGSEDAAMLITLPPGAYTVEVKGKNDTEGVALLEIYEVP